MSSPNRKQLTELIIQWVRQNGHFEQFSDPQITEDTDLMASGLLDSFGFVDLLLFIESQSGIKVDLTDVDPSEFALVKGLCDIALSNDDDSCQQPVEMGTSQRFAAASGVERSSL